jgi:hypothetical protein
VHIVILQKIIKEEEEILTSEAQLVSVLILFQEKLVNILLLQKMVILPNVVEHILITLSLLSMVIKVLFTRLGVINF